MEAAEYLLENGPLADQAHISRCRQAITARRRELLEELDSRCEALQKRALEADLAPANLDMVELKRRCVASWPETVPLIEQAEAAFEDELLAGKRALRARLAQREAADTIDFVGAESSGALIDAGLLRAAARQIDDGQRSSGPERVPPLPVWRPDMSPEQLLEWHLDPVQHQRQTRYAAWAPADVSARQLLEAYASLSDGGFDTAHRSQRHSTPSFTATKSRLSDPTRSLADTSPPCRRCSPNRRSRGSAPWTTWTCSSVDPTLGSRRGWTRSRSWRSARPFKHRQAAAATRCSVCGLCCSWPRCARDAPQHCCVCWDPSGHWPRSSAVRRTNSTSCWGRTSPRGGRLSAGSST